MSRCRRLAAAVWGYARHRVRWRGLIPVALFGLSILFTVHYVASNSQQRCSSLLADASIPLPHPIAGNPSREWESAFEKNAAARARQLGCGR